MKLNNHSNLFDNRNKNQDIRVSLVVFTIGIIIMSLLHTYFKPFAFKGVYFQEWGSEDMMQTVSILDLRDQPLQSLLFLHIQPPLLDIIRAVFVHIFPNFDSSKLLIQVDLNLYAIWTILYAMMGAILYRWLAELLENPMTAFISSILFLLHPAAIFYSNFLDGTFLTAFCMMLLIYSLWKVPKGGPIWPVTISFLLLFFIRSIYQFPIIIILTISLFLCKIPAQKIIQFVVVSSVFVGFFMIKQYLIFGTVSTSSFTGINCLRSIGILPDTKTIDDPTPPLGFILQSKSPSEYPTVLTRYKKLSGQLNYNNYAELGVENYLFKECIRIVKNQSIVYILLSYFENFQIYIMPSSRYITSHVIVDHLPWRSAYDFIFSKFSLIILITFAGAWWLVQHSKKDINYAIGLLLPLLFTFVASVFFEKGENMRFKFFIEPVLYVFIITQLYRFIQFIRKLLFVNFSRKTS